MSPVTIAGSGLAELTCAWLLVGRGHRIQLAASEPGAGTRPLLLTGPTLELLRSVWGAGLLDDAWELTHRRVRWGAGVRSARFAQAGRVVDGAVLAARMRERLEAWPTPDAGGPARWTVTAQVVGGAPVAHHTLGRRRLLAGTAPLRAGRDERTAVLDTTGLGWVQLTPLGAGDCLVQAMVPGPAEDPAGLLARLLTESAAGDVLRRPPDTVAAIPAAPRLHPAPALTPTDELPHGLLTVGAGAIRYDPLSGTGTAQALRTAVLAAAVIDADAGGTPAAALCRHYTARLRAAFNEHLATCSELYASAFASRAWQDELDAARLGPRTAGRPEGVGGVP
ncbi:hypothetical protein [Streptomyces sp. NPDC091371]|uniref:hypothetical protein n=1 Tax=Streptomyces sp. NPDC091371 TaxID=3155303 RepID=UPI0034210899